MTIKTFSVQGMTCQGCVKTVEKVVSNLNGVSQVRVNLAEGKAEVDYDEHRVKPQEIIEAIENAGFDAEERDV